MCGYYPDNRLEDPKMGQLGPVNMKEVIEGDRTENQTCHFNRLLLNEM